MAQTRTSSSKADIAARGNIALEAAQEAVRASIEAAQKIADCSMEAGSEASQRVQKSLKDALEALRAAPSKSEATPSRRTA
jgi:hypothetical protein